MELKTIIVLSIVGYALIGAVGGFCTRAIMLWRHVASGNEKRFEFKFHGDEILPVVTWMIWPIMVPVVCLAFGYDHLMRSTDRKIEARARRAYLGKHKATGGELSEPASGGELSSPLRPNWPEPSGSEPSDPSGSSRSGL